MPHFLPFNLCLAPFLSTLLCPSADEAHYHLWSIFHGQDHECPHTYQKRLSKFLATKAKVVAHNTKATAAATGAGAGATSKAATEDEEAGSYSLGLTRFADWDREEFDRVMLPKKWRRDHVIPEKKVSKG